MEPAPLPSIRRASEQRKDTEDVFSGPESPSVGSPCGASAWILRIAYAPFHSCEGQVKVNTLGYTGELGPDNWVALDATANALCAAGTRQSPITMVYGQFHIADSSDIVLEIPDQPEGIVFENLGTTVEGVLEGKGGRLELGGVEYELKQFHIHHPSEHLDNVEVHNVFESADGQLAVIGVYVEVDLGTTVTVAARRRRDVLSEAVEGKNFEIMATSAVPETDSISSNMLETVFQSIEEIATPGASVTTAPLVLKISPAILHRVVNVVKFNARFTQNSLGSPNILSFAAQAALASPPTTA
ncbi:Alpha carbonic anhydrase 8 [Seiridium cupressi]